MFKKQKPRQLDPRVKYQQRQFKGKLARARDYQRPATGSLAALLRKFNWRLFFGVAAIFAVAWYISFVPNFLFVRTIVVEGGRESVNAEVRGQVLRYIEGKYLVFPKKNLLFTSKRDLTSYVTTANAHVWKVDIIQKKWPHTLHIRIVPRESAFAWTSGEQQVFVANDGSVIPASEAGDISRLLPVFGKLPVRTDVGASVFTDNLLASLTILRNDFSHITALPTITRVDLVPVLAESFPITQPSSSGGAGQDVAATTTATPPPPTNIPTVLDVPPRELKVRVAAGNARSMPEFSVLLDIDDTNIATLTRLKQLLDGQSADRLKQLAYVDMRFDSRVYICLITAPCAKDGTTPPISE